jgi:hypothetical protein
VQVGSTPPPPPDNKTRADPAHHTMDSQFSQLISRQGTNPLLQFSK